jgi:hypothetical protein
MTLRAIVNKIELFNRLPYYARALIAAFPASLIRFMQG